MLSPLSLRHLKRQNQLLELLKIWGSKSRRGVPSCRSIPCRPWNDAGTGNGLSALGTNAVASNALAERDVVQGGPPNGVERRVDESERGLTCAESSVVEKANNGSNDGGCGGCSSGWRQFATVHDLITDNHVSILQHAGRIREGHTQG